MNPQSYFTELKLFNLSTLQNHCEENGVKLIASPTSPNLVMLHYKPETHFEQKWTPFSLMCRGLIVDMDKRQILAYPYDKFFNLGEHPDTKYEALVGKPFLASEKLDGSFLIHFWDEATHQARLTTKGSFTSEQGIYATTIIPEHLRQKSFTEDYTLMFELIDPKYRIVINYAKKDYAAGLYLVGARSKINNRLMTYEQLQTLARIIKVPVVHLYQFSDLNSLLARVNTLPESEEGYVLEFPDSLRVKVKSLAYLKAHKFISQLSDSAILEALKNGLEETLIQTACEEYRTDIQNKLCLFKDSKKEVETEVENLFLKAPKDDKKTFALWVMQNVSPRLRGHMFHLWEGKPLSKELLYREVAVRTNASKDTKI